MGLKILQNIEYRKAVKSNGMAKTSFARTVVKTICEVKYVDENNDVQNATIELYGDYNIDGAQNAARKKLENNRLVVAKVTHKSYYGKMSMQDFEKYCEKANFKEW